VTRDELLSRITINAQACFGKPCTRGHRIRVSLVLDLLASGSTVDEILVESPYSPIISVRLIRLATIV
jgi:uncharacterized protein (DUF433 family)